jgi:hypothetical protein
MAYGVQRVRYRMTKLPHLVRRTEKIGHHDGDHSRGMGRANTIVRVLENKASRGIFG